MSSLSTFKFSIEKQSSEKVTIGIDFAADMNSTEVISTATITAIDLSDDSDVSGAVLDGSAQIQNGDQTSSNIAQKIKAGTDGQRIKITFKATTDDPHILEADLIVTIKE